PVHGRHPPCACGMTKGDGGLKGIIAPVGNLAEVTGGHGAGGNQRDKKRKQVRQMLRADAARTRRRRRPGKCEGNGEVRRKPLLREGAWPGWRRGQPARSLWREETRCAS
ncbi:hypothetical protein D4764_04G0003600, partial [Takifugu flavidus]